MGVKTKIFLLSVFLVFFGLLIADVVVSLKHRGRIPEGAKGFICEAFKFSDFVVNGYESEHEFLGLENVDSIVGNLSGMVESNSSLMVSISNIVDQTLPISVSVNVFLEYLSHTSLVLGDPTNNFVGQYECIFCKQLNDSMVQDSIISISSSLASSLAQVRENVQSQLSGDGLVSIQSSLASASSVIDSFKHEVENGVSSGLIENHEMFDKILSYINTASIVIISSIGVPAIMVIITVFFGVFRSSIKSYSDPKIRPRNPLFSSCSWCITFLFAFLFFLLAGILGLVAYASSSACEVLGDMHRFISILPTESNMKDILTNCLTLNGSGDILGSIPTGNGTTAKDTLNISSLINSQFDVLTLLSSSTQFSTIPQLVNLFDSLSNYGSLYTISPNAINAVSTDPSFHPSPQLIAHLGSLSTFESLMQSGLEGVPDCDGRLNISGANGFYNTLSMFGVDIGADSTLTCPASFANLNPPNLALAHPFEIIMDWKIQVLSHTFRCDSVFISVDPSGTISSNRTPAYCSWAQWIQYVNDMHNQLVTYAQNVDTTQANTLNAISNDLRDIVQGTVLPQIDTLANGLDCKFMYTSFNNIYGDICYLQTPGLIYAAITWFVFGALSLICILIEFVIWRHLRDNLSIWLDFKNQHSSSIRVSQIEAAIPSPRIFSQATIGYRAQDIVMNS